MGASTPYGSPPAVLAPSDNVLQPTQAQAEADQLAQQIETLYEDLENALRDPNAGNAKPPTKP